jgi:hypothetical protein
MCGPSIEFSDYLNFIELKNEYENIPQDLAMKDGLKDLGISVVLILIKVFFEKKFNLEYLASDEIYAKSYAYKIVYAYIAMAMLKAKYYIGWTMANSVLTFSGFSYNPQTTENGIVAKFDRIDNCNIYMMEVEINPKIKIQVINNFYKLHLVLE